MKNGNLLQKLTILTIGIAVIGFALNMLFGFNTVTYMETININGVVFQKYNFWNYIENIRNNFSQVAELSIEVPNLQWSNSGDLTVDMVRNLQVIANVIIFGINILIYPLRIAFFIIKTILALIGLPIASADTSNNPLNWLIVLTKTMVNLQLGYVQIL